MKKATAIILSLMLALFCASALMEETAELPQIVPAESVDVFLGDWAMTGILQGDTLYTPDEWAKLKGLDSAPGMELSVGESSLTVSSSGYKSVVSFTMNTEEGCLDVSDKSGAGSIKLRDDGSVLFCYDNGEDSYAVVFTKK